MADKRGGKRPGAGRKPKAEKYERQINAAEKRIADKLPAIVDAQITLALGVVVEEIEDGETTVYQKPPDGQAGRYLIDRLLGKPTERQEIEAEISGTLEVNDAATKAAAAKLDEWRKEQSEKLHQLTTEPPSSPPAPLT